MKSITAFLLLLFCQFSLSAAESQAAERIRITTPTHDDLYLAGENISLEAPVFGDVVAAGANIFLEDSITGDAILAGGSLEIKAPVSDDVRAFGGNLDVYSTIGGDLLVFAGDVHIHREALIKGDVLVFGGNLVLRGKIEGSLQAYGGSIDLEAPVGENAEIKAGELLLNSRIAGNANIVAEIIETGEGARVEGSLRYWTSLGESDFSAISENVIFDPQLGEDYDDGTWDGFGFFSFMGYSFLAVILFAILMIFAFNPYFVKAVDPLRSETFKSFGFGILYFIAVPIAIFILMISVIGIPVGLLSGFLYFFSLLFAPAIAAILITYWLNSRRSVKWHRWLKVLISGVIFIIVLLITIIPFIGWLFGLFITAASFGALILGSSQKRTASLTA